VLFARLPREEETKESAAHDADAAAAGEATEQTRRTHGDKNRHAQPGSERGAMQNLRPRDFFLWLLRLSVPASSPLAVLAVLLLAPLPLLLLLAAVARVSVSSVCGASVLSFLPFPLPVPVLLPLLLPPFAFGPFPFWASRLPSTSVVEPVPGRFGSRSGTAVPGTALSVPWNRGRNTASSESSGAALDAAAHTPNGDQWEERSGGPGGRETAEGSAGSSGTRAAGRRRSHCQQRPAASPSPASAARSAIPLRSGIAQMNPSH
jgi:hypothetical protein